MIAVISLSCTGYLLTLSIIQLPTLESNRMSFLKIRDSFSRACPQPSLAFGYWPVFTYLLALPSFQSGAVWLIRLNAFPPPLSALHIRASLSFHFCLSSENLISRQKAIVWSELRSLSRNSAPGYHSTSAFDDYLQLWDPLGFNWTDPFARYNIIYIVSVVKVHRFFLASSLSSISSFFPAGVRDFHSGGRLSNSRN